MDEKLFDRYLAEAGVSRGEAAAKIGMAEQELNEAVAGERELTGAQRWELAGVLGIQNSLEAQEDVFWPEGGNTYEQKQGARAVGGGDRGRAAVLRGACLEA